MRLKPSDSKTAPVWVSLEELFAVPKAQREKWLKEHAGLKGARTKALAADLAAIEKKHAGAPPSRSRAGAGGTAPMTLQLSPSLREGAGGGVSARKRRWSASSKSASKTAPSRTPAASSSRPGEERKRTSSHYTPPELSGPIVARALEPLLACFGDAPTSTQILSLKVCDPAMGSGAFLVEACRYLGERLLEVWTRESVTGTLFGAEDDLTTYARRQVAERCLYGVDKNPVAVEIAKLSLWLVTLQKDKPFTFLDHSLRCGDALVGCSIEQITEFHWSPKAKKKQRQLDLFDRELADSLSEALAARERIVDASRLDTAAANRDMQLAMRDADDALSRLRLIGDLVIGAFFSEASDKAREKERLRRKGMIEASLLDTEAIGAPAELIELAEEVRRKLRPFHLMLEFPEVFWAGRVDPLTGSVEKEPAYLDAVIGNPPFAGKNTVTAQYRGMPILDYLKAIHTGAYGNADLCAHFFRRAPDVLGRHGTAGLIATNTIAEGDTRATGLQHPLADGWTIYSARPSIPWQSGDAAVMISVVHLGRGRTIPAPPFSLGDALVPAINSRLRATAERAAPRPLSSNRGVALGARSSCQRPSSSHPRSVRSCSRVIHATPSSSDHFLGAQS